MLVGAYPFEDPEDPRNFRKTIGVSYLQNADFKLDKRVTDYLPTSNIVCTSKSKSVVILGRE